MSENIETQPLRAGGSQAQEDRPRDVRRCVVEIDCATNGHVICGHRVKLGLNRIEVYVDDVPRIEAQVRTQEDHDAEAMAKRLYQKRVDEWIAEKLRGVPLEDTEAKTAYLLKRCPVAFGDDLSRLGYERGLPPFLSAVRVKGSETDAPPTPENIAAKANDRLAEAIAKAITKGSRGKD